MPGSYDIPSAPTLILDMLATGEQATYSVQELIRAGAAFDIEPTGIRTAITRLKAEQRLRQVARGCYATGPSSEPLQHRIRGWRTVLQRRRSWNSEWLLAIAGPPERADRTLWRRTVRALELEGFAEAETNVWARPDNLEHGAAGMRMRLDELGYAASLLVVAARGLDDGRQARFTALWDCRAIAGEHARLADMLDRSAGRLESADDATAAAETLALGRQAIRAIVRDPLLPDELCPPDALSGLIAAMTRYDRLGKAVWRRYLGG